METRKTLIERVRDQQDEKSWEEFTHFYSAYIYSIIHRMGMGHHDTEDLRQHVLMKVWKAIPEMKYDRNKAKFRTWLTRIIRNELTDYSRRKANKSKALECEMDQGILSILEDSELDKVAEQEWIKHVTELALVEIEKSFDGKLVQAFKLFASGKKGEEVAEKCGLSINSVYIYKKRVQNAMMKEILRLEQELV